MPRKKHSISRRGVIRSGIAGAAAVSLGSLLSQRPARAEDLPMLAEDDPTAQTLGYKADAAEVDTTKFPKRAGADGDKQFCDTCQLYVAEGDGAAGKCSIFPGKLVAAKGWCNAFLPKTG